MTNLSQWIETTFSPVLQPSTSFLYDDMASQSGESLPLIYLPFDLRNPSHWSDRGWLWDFLSATRTEAAHLLDFGPGDGWPSLLAAPFCASVTGVDGSARRVETCRANAARLGLENTRFVHVPPGQPLPFDDNSFDGAAAASSIEQTPDPLFTLRELHRVLKPGGRLRIAYESLGAYNGAERALDISSIEPGCARLILYDRDLAAETAREYQLLLDLPADEARRLLPPEAVAAGWEEPARSWLETLQRHTTATSACHLRHPSGPSLLRMLHEVGFAGARTTHSAGRAAWRLYHSLPTQQHPTTLAELDALLRPFAAVVVELEAPARAAQGFDPPVTAVKQ